MSLNRRGLIPGTSAACVTALVAVLCTWATTARAQRVDDGSDRFFANKVNKKQDAKDETIVQGSLTLTNFLFTEVGGNSVQNPALIANYSPALRLFTDLRAQLDVKKIGGSSWDLRTDARVRVSPGCNFQSIFARPALNDQLKCKTQSGTLGGNEYDIRELFAKRTGEKTDLYLGRQFVTELAATKLDGLKFNYHVNKRWDLLGFAGLNPSRISRSILADYPSQVDADGNQGGPVLPITAGLGGSYRLPNIYGSMGVVGIVPLAEDRENQGINENPRIFLTDNGYWRPSSNLDVYHYAVIDLQSAAGFGITNLSLGANYRPVPGFTVNAAINRVDTESLNSIVQTQTLDVDVSALAIPYNYQRVLRIASDSARVSLSMALAQQRFELSTSAQIRQREQAELLIVDNMSLPQVIPAARNAEFQVSFVDRRSIAGLRLGGNVSAIIPLGKDTPNRSTAQIARLMLSRMFMDERAQLDFDLSFVNSSDIEELGNCVADPITCYGRTDVMMVSTNTLFYYRFARDWLAIANAGIGYQSFNDGVAAQPANLLFTGFLRVAYRF